MKQWRRLGETSGNPFELLLAKKHAINLQMRFFGPFSHIVFFLSVNRLLEWLLLEQRSS
jgi:hypothetical protein